MNRTLRVRKGQQGYSLLHLHSGLIARENFGGRSRIATCDVFPDGVLVLQTRAFSVLGYIRPYKRVMNGL